MKDHRDMVDSNVQRCFLDMIHEQSAQKSTLITDIHSILLHQEWEISLAPAFDRKMSLRKIFERGARQEINPLFPQCL